MYPDYLKAYETFILYAFDTTGCVFTGDRKGLYVCYTNDMVSVELPSHFVRDRDVVAVSTVAQSMTRYTKRKVQTAVLAKQFKERMGLMTSMDVADMAHHGMIEDCAVSTQDPYRETAIWNKSLAVLQGKE